MPSPAGRGGLLRYGWPLLVIVLAAGIVRIPGIPHELPHLYTHDEVSTVETALRFGSGSLRPYSFGHGSLMAYLMAVFYGAYYGWLRLTGSLAGPDDFVLRYLADPTPFYLIHRGFTASLALALVVLVYLVARRVFSRRAGLIAALLTAFVNILFVLSIAGREDLLYLLLLVAGVYASLTIYEGRASAGSWAASGALVGLATATKYFGVFGLLFPLLASRGRTAGVARGGLCMMGGFLSGLAVAMPFAVLHVQNFFGDVLKLASQTSGGMDGTWLDGLAYPTIHLMNSVGLPLQMTFLLGVVVLFVRDRRAAVYVLVPPLLFLGALAIRSGNQGYYYVAFAVPFICVAVARAIDHVMALPSPSRWLRWILGGVLVAVVLWPNVTADLRYLQYLSMPDTRDVSRAWIERNIRPGSSILIETRASDFGIRQGPPLRESVETLRRELSEIRRRGGSGRFWEYKIAWALRDGTEPRYELVKVHTIRPEVVEAQRWEFVVASLGPDSDGANYRSLRERAVLLAMFPSSANFPGDVLATMEELSTLPPHLEIDHRMRGPTVSIWKRKTA